MITVARERHLSQRNTGMGDETPDRARTKGSLTRPWAGVAARNGLRTVRDASGSGLQCQGPAATSGILCSVTEDLCSARQERLQIDSISRQRWEEHSVFRLEPEVDKGQNGTCRNG